MVRDIIVAIILAIIIPYYTPPYSSYFMIINLQDDNTTISTVHCHDTTTHPANFHRSQILSHSNHQTVARSVVTPNSEPVISSVRCSVQGVSDSMLV